MTMKEKIFSYIKKAQPVSPKIILENVGIGEQMLYRHLKKLLSEMKIEKIGSSPKVFYKVKIQSMLDEVSLRKKTIGVLDENFYSISAQGKELFGSKGFIAWCKQRDLDAEKKAKEFIQITKKYQKLRKNNLLDATSKLKNTFNEGADELYYYDFYSIEVFGKTKMGQKLLYAKQSENTKLMKEIITEIQPTVIDLIKNKQIDAVAYVQPTVPRKIQFMKILEKGLGLALPLVKVIKVISDIRVPQKTLKKLSDRVENADETFVVEGDISYKKVLLIDDAVGSGASINQVAKKIKEKGLAKKVIGFVVTGSLNDFDVISEA